MAKEYGECQYCKAVVTYYKGAGAVENVSDGAPWISIETGEYTRWSHWACHDKWKRERYKKDRVVLTSVWTEAAIAQIRSDKVEPWHATLLQDMENVCIEAKVFEREVWWPAVQNYYQISDRRGHKTRINGIDVLLWGSAGRVLITTEDASSQVTLICIEDNPLGKSSMGVKSIEATADRAVEMIREVRLGYAANPFKSDDQVSFA